MRTTPFPLSAGLSIAYFYRNCFSILIRLALTNFPIMSYTSWTYKSSPMYQYHSLPQTNSHWTVSTFLQLTSWSTGQERLPGYVHLFIVPTKSVATMIFYKKDTNNIKRSMLWNGYPRRLTKKCISLFPPSTTTDNLNTENVNADRQ